MLVSGRVPYICIWLISPQKWAPMGHHPCSKKWLSFLDQMLQPTSRKPGGARELLGYQGCRFGPESSRQTLVSPILRSGNRYHLWRIVFGKCVSGTNLQPWLPAGLLLASKTTSVGGQENNPSPY